MQNLRLLSPVVLFCLFILPARAHASTQKALTCSSGDVQKAINSAATGDTVVVPSGSCAWTTPVSITSKSITLQGQTACTGTPTTSCTDSTVITDNTGANGALNISGASAINFVRVTGFTFKWTASLTRSNGYINVDGTQGAIAFRFDHNHLITTICCTRGYQVTDVYGLIDHSLFDVTATSGSIQSISVWGSNDSTDGGFTPWTRPLTLGTANAVYEEDNTFNYSNHDETATDNYGGARFVIRHNLFNGNELGGDHGTDSGNRRSGFSFEIYSNTLNNNTGSHLRAATVRGGTGVVYNNTFQGSSPWDGVTLMVYRACPPLDQSTWGTSDGTKWQLGSTDLSSNGSRTVSINGGTKFCSLSRDTLCTSDSTCTAISGGTCSTYFDGSGAGGYPARDQPGVTHGQVISPVYVWNNSGNGGTVNAGSYDGGQSCGLGISNYLQEKRDFVNGTPMPGYSAFTYPHPLQNSVSSSGPSSPTGLSAVAK